MEEKKTEAEDKRMLRWIAGCMGFELHRESEYSDGILFEPDRWWFMSRPMSMPCPLHSPGWRTTRSFYTPRRLLNRVLESETAFLDRGEALRNPFYGMSRSEVMLRMAAAGV